MADIFKTICLQCGGYCCSGYPIFLTSPETKKLKLAGYEFKYLKQGSGYITKVKSESSPCVFLRPGSGCSLKKSLKPTDCDLFPLGFIFKSGKFEFYLLKDCGFLKEITKKDIAGMKKRALKRLAKWSEKEIKTYSNLIKSWPKSDLIAV